MGVCCRFTWPDHANIKIKPSTGHLLANTSTDLLLSFEAAAPVALTPAELLATCTEIKIPGTHAPWHNQMTTLVEAPGGKVDQAGHPVMQAVAVLEPKVEAVKGGEKKLPLKVFAVADNPTYDNPCTSNTVDCQPFFQHWYHSGIRATSFVPRFSLIEGRVLSDKPCLLFPVCFYLPLDTLMISAGLT